MGWLERHKIEDYIISNLREKYPQFTTTTEYDFINDYFLIHIWNGDYFKSDLFLSLQIANWNFKSKEEIVDEVVKAIEKKLNPPFIPKKKIILKKCECCGAILNSLTCEYCGAQYMEV